MKKYLILLCCLSPALMLSQEPEVVPSQLIVQSTSIDQLMEEFPEIIRTKTLSSHSGIFLITLGNPQLISRTLADLKRHRLVLHAQYNHLLQNRGTEATIPDDPDFANQWALENTGQTGGTPDADIDAPEAWDLSTGQTNVFGDSLVVAVIDDGFDLQHEDLNFFVHRNEIAGNGIDDDGNGYIDDVNGWNPGTQSGVITLQAHGTHVSGIAAARTDNLQGCAGVAWGPAILPIQVQTYTEADVVAAYNYILDQRILYDQSGGALGAFVVATNSSFGINFGDPANFPIWCAMYDTLGQHGILSAVATMNIGQNVDVVNDVPSACPSPFLISVTNTTATDQKSNGAAFGATTIDLGAPGTAILSTLPNDVYGLQTGTSMASPQVAGAVLIMHGTTFPGFYAQYLADPAAGSLLIRDFILAGVDSLPALQGITTSGGRLNLPGAISRMQAYSDTLSDDCLPAYQLSASQMTDSSALLSWNSGDSASQFIVRYRVLGDSLWSDSSFTDSMFVLIEDLTACSQYQFQVKVICAGDTIDFLASASFRTEGCCEPPANRMVDSSSDSTISLSWQSVFGASAYQIQVREAGTTILSTFSTTDTTLLLDSLSSCTIYEWRIATSCDSSGLLFSAWEEVRTLGCGVCQDAEYCSSRSSDASFEWIESVTIGNLQLLSGNNGGYVFSESPFLSLVKDSSYSLTLSPGYQQFSFDEWWRIWIDLNQDGVFTDSTEKLFDSGSGLSGPVSGMLTIPDSVLSGPTRMRISMKFPGFISPDGPGPCETFDGGEVEDYCVVFADSGQSNCGSPEINTLAFNPLTQELTIQASEVPGATGYQLLIDGPGYPAGFFLPSDSASGTFILAFGQCATYTITLKALCGQTVGGSESQTITTSGCGNCIDLDYCEAVGLRSDSLWLEGFSINQSILQTGNDSGYIFFDSQTIDLTVFDNLTGWILPGGTGNDSAWVGMWIDVDADGVWLPSERILSTQTAPGDSAAIAWLVPQNISLEGARIRLMVSREPIVNSCYSPQMGEVEDLCFTGFPVGLAPDLSGLLKVFPNPFQDEIIVQRDASLPSASVSLYDSQGRLILRKESLHDSEYRIPTADLPAGIYWIQAEVNGGRISKTIVKRD